LEKQVIKPIPAVISAAIMVSLIFKFIDIGELCGAPFASAPVSIRDILYPQEQNVYVF